MKKILLKILFCFPALFAASCIVTAFTMFDIRFGGSIVGVIYLAAFSISFRLLYSIDKKIEEKGYIEDFKELEQTIPKLDDALCRQHEIYYQLITVLNKSNAPDLSERNLALFAFQAAHLNFLYNKAKYHYNLCRTFRYRCARFFSQTDFSRFRNLPKLFKAMERNYMDTREDCDSYLSYKFFSLFPDQS